MSLPFNITNPGFFLSTQLTSGEAAFVTELAGLSPSDGSIFVYRTGGGAWTLEAKPAGGANPAMADITDITFTSLTDGDVLTYDSFSGDWINQAPSGGVGVTDGDKGDITVSSSGTVWTIDDEAVTLAKMAHVPTNRILGRSTAGTGDVEALADGAVRDIIGLDTTDSPQFAGVNIGHATDTTITRVSAGVIAVEGVNVQLQPTEGGFVDGDKTKLDAAVQPGDDADTLGSGAATDGWVLTSDGAGNAVWEAVPGGGGGDAWSDPVDSDIIPGTSSAYDLGSASAVFSKAYINTYYFPDEFAFRETASDNVLLFGSNQGSAVNYFQIQNSATGNPLEFQAVGTDTNIAINLNTKGTGEAQVNGNEIYHATGTDVPVTDGGTGASTAAGARTNLGAATANEAVVPLGNLGTTEAIDLSAGGFFHGTLDANVTITFTNEAEGLPKTIILGYDGTAQRTITMSDVDEWANGAAPLGPTSTAKETIVTAVKVNGTVYGFHNTVVASGGGGVTITNGTGAPSSTPAAIGDMYLDTDNNRVYHAFGASSSADWRYVSTVANPV